MSGYYGHLFTSQFKTTESLRAAKLFWLEKLSAKSPASIKDALTRMAEKHTKPPSLPEFLNLFKYTQEEALNAGHYDKQALMITKSSKKYADGEPTPALIAANKIISDRDNKELKEIKTINDEDHARLMRESETYCQSMSGGNQ